MWGKTPDSTNSFTYFTEETWTFVSELSAESANFMPDSKTVEILQNQRPLSRKIHPDGLDHHLIWPMIHMCLVKGLCICFSKGNLLVFPVLFTQWSTQQWSPLALFHLCSLESVCHSELKWECLLNSNSIFEFEYCSKQD